jgi:hypothetical protein
LTISESQAVIAHQPLNKARKLILTFGFAILLIKAKGHQPGQQMHPLVNDKTLRVVEINSRLNICSTLALIFRIAIMW